MLGGLFDFGVAQQQIRSTGPYLWKIQMLDDLMRQLSKASEREAAIETLMSFAKDYTAKLVAEGLQLQEQISKESQPQISSTDYYRPLGL